MLPPKTYTSALLAPKTWGLSYTALHSAVQEVLNAAQTNPSLRKALGEKTFQALEHATRRTQRRNETSRFFERWSTPPTTNWLIACTYQTGCLFCVIGALLPSTRKYSAEPNSSIEQLFAQDKKVRKQAKRLGLSLSELMSLQKLNDHIVARPKERYRLIVNWIASHS